MFPSVNMYDLEIFFLVQITLLNTLCLEFLFVMKEHIYDLMQLVHFNVFSSSVDCCPLQFKRHMKHIMRCKTKEPTMLVTVFAHASQVCLITCLSINLK